MIVATVMRYVRRETMEREGRNMFSRPISS